MVGRHGAGGGHRHQLAHPAGAQPCQVPVPVARQSEGARRDRALHPGEAVRGPGRRGPELPQPASALTARPALPRRAPPDQSRARLRQGPARGRPREQGDHQHHGQRGGPPAPPGPALGPAAPRHVGPGERGRQPPGEAPRLRVLRRLWLPHRLPDERRHGHAGFRDAAPARPGDDAPDRQGLSGGIQDQPRGARLLRGGHPGVRRLAWRRRGSQAGSVPGERGRAGGPSCSSLLPRGTRHPNLGTKR